LFQGPDDNKFDIKFVDSVPEVREMIHYCGQLAYITRSPLRLSALSSQGYRTFLPHIPQLLLRLTRITENTRLSVQSTNLTQLPFCALMMASED
jgi:hypothetical protein